MGYAINKLTNLIIELAGGKISSTLVDVKSNNNKINKIRFNLDKCNYASFAFLPIFVMYKFFSISTL